jgi:sigma-B regulation protein RsbU (phosphoserine phosphatase)
MPAALFMVRALTLLRGEAGRYAGARLLHAERILDRVNRMLADRNDRLLFVSVFCALLDTDTGDLAYVNAGHNPPALMLPDGRIELLEEPRNPVAGIMDGLAFRGGELELARGTRLVLYTDGVTEAQRADDAEFGMERFLASLAQPIADCALRQTDALIARVVEAVDAFTGETPQSDDITLLALEYRGQ